MSTSTIDTETWIQNRIKPDEIARYLDRGKDFISDQNIEEELNIRTSNDPEKVRDILAKSLSIKTLSPSETACLLNVKDEDLWTEMRDTALKIKKKVYDNRIVTFAPLYLGNYCVNNCLYCGFRSDNLDADRKVLDFDQIRSDTAFLCGEIGHKRLVVVYGEHPYMDLDYMIASIRAIYDVKIKTRHGYGNIRRVSVNAPPMSITDLRDLNALGIGTYQVFQETYHRETYARLHPKGTLKADYLWRLYTMHRALEAGIEDVGIGVLFGLYDWRFEIMGLLHHSLELEKRFGVGPHTVSFPRLEPALNAPFSLKRANQISDADLMKVITVLRLAIPHAGLVLTARENPVFREEAMSLGITQMDASSKIGIGAYSNDIQNQNEANQQFILGDTRTLDQMVYKLAKMGYITSFCTSGYRCGRRGRTIIGFLRDGKEARFCKLNAVLTYREWLDDFASNETKQAGEKLILKEMDEIKTQMPELVSALSRKYNLIQQGQRDLFF